jgi:hypothetical protein
LGIDIGIGGAIAVFEDGAPIEIHDMPVLGDGPAKRRSVNAPLLAEIIFGSHAEIAFVESVNARPGEGPAGAFAFGRCRGVVEGVLAAAGIPVRFITPVVWKKEIGIASGKDGAKDAARSEAIRRWPHQAKLFRLKQDADKAEACLIAVAGQQRERLPLFA